MYNNTSIPASELYGIGKGLAQVNDPKIWLEQQRMGEERAQRQEAEKERAAKAIHEDMLSRLSKIKDGAIRTEDQPEAAQRINDYKKLVQGIYANAKGGQLGVDDELKLQQGLNGLNTWTDNASKQAQLIHQVGAEYDKNDVRYGGSWNKDEFLDAATKPMSEWKNQDITSYLPIPKKDLDQEFLKANKDYFNSNNIASVAYDPSGQLKITTITNPDLVEQRKNQFFNDPDVQVQLHMASTKLPKTSEFSDKGGVPQGLKTREDYLQQVGTPDEFFDYRKLFNDKVTYGGIKKESFKQPPPPSSIGGATFSQTLPVSHEVDANGNDIYTTKFGDKGVLVPFDGKNELVTNATYNTITDPKTGKKVVVGGTATVAKNSDENDKLLAKFNEDEKKIQERIDKYDAENQPLPTDKEEYHLAYRNKMMDFAKEKRELYNNYKKALQVTTKPLDETQAKDLFTSTHKGNVNQMVNGVPLSGVKVVDNRAKATSEAPKGEAKPKKVIKGF